MLDIWKVILSMWLSDLNKMLKRSKQPKYYYEKNYADQKYEIDVQFTTFKAMKV